MSQPANQYDTELLMKNVLKHGDKSRLAEKLRVSLSEISQQVNPNELRKSHFFECKRFLLALKLVNKRAAQILLCDLDFSINGDSELDEGDLPDLTGAVVKEAADLVCAQLKGKPAHIQRQECLEIIAVGYRFLSALDGAVHRKGARVATRATADNSRQAVGNQKAVNE